MDEHEHEHERINGESPPEPPPGASREGAPGTPDGRGEGAGGPPRPPEGPPGASGPDEPPAARIGPLTRLQIAAIRGHEDALASERASIRAVDEEIANLKKARDQIARRIDARHDEIMAAIAEEHGARGSRSLRPLKIDGKTFLVEK